MANNANGVTSRVRTAGPTEVAEPTNPVPQNNDPYAVADENVADEALQPPVPVEVPQADGALLTTKPMTDVVPPVIQNRDRNVETRRSQTRLSQNVASRQQNRTPSVRSRQLTVRSQSQASQRQPTRTSQSRASRTSRSSRSGTSRSVSRTSTAQSSISTGSRLSATTTESSSSSGRSESYSRTGLTTASSGVRLLDWVPLLVGNESPQYFSEGIQHLEGWISEPKAEYPIEILLGLEYISNVYKVEIKIVDHLVPEKIEVRVGRSGQLDRNMTYKTAREAEYELKGTVTFEKPTSKNVEEETKTIFVDYEAQYVWLTLFEPLRNRLNKTNQVRIGSLALYGYPLDKTKYSPYRAPSNNRRQDLRTRDSGSSFISLVSLTNSNRSNRSSRSNATRSVENFNGFRSYGDNLASDPLVSLRVAKNVLGKRMENVQRRGLDVQATVIKRAIELLNDYEKQMLTMKQQMSTAMTERNYDEAKKQFLAMIDVRDLAFRVVHLDLLLGKQELRALGVTSTWSEDK
ncbi:unnamed protein product [Bursaphelenchus okinawaensis]|uniref:Centrosomal protein CEP104 N-terminal domain-containing protein n=1 Tax=Bursaphelenchus okinawaensis TaxID=465554 RepID=A0A811K649_9BILA|nr:unnamed protein product [Bursaphelenchus okinawaensis]CAG9093625.1 unnamed protein product [Bursaphelenchus okinawaensis]